MKLAMRSVLGVCVFIVAVNFTLLKCGAPAWVTHLVALVLGFGLTSLAERDEARMETTP